MRSLVLMAALFFVTSNNSQAQIKIDGPKESPSGELVQIFVTELKAKDLKVVVLKDGEPANKGFSVLKDFNDQVVISFFTKEQGTFSILLAGNQDNKTHTAFHILKLTGLDPPKPKPEPNPNPKPPEPNPKPPEPEPEPQSFKAKVKAAYDLNPDPAAKAQLQVIFKDMKSLIDQDRLRNYGDFETTLAAMGQEKLGPNKLQNVRQLISAQIISKVGTDPRRWNKQIILSSVEEILGALE